MNGEHGGLPSGSCIQTAAQGKPSQSGDQAALEAPLGWNWSSLSCLSQNRPLTCSSSPLSSLPPLFCTAVQTGLSGWATLHRLRCVSISHRILSVTVSPHSLPAPPPPPFPRPALSPTLKRGTIRTAPSRPPASCHSPHRNLTHWPESSPGGLNDPGAPLQKPTLRSTLNLRDHSHLPCPKSHTPADFPSP